MILVVSRPGDDHARYVMHRLGALGAHAVLLDLARYPARMSLALRAGPRRGPRAVLRDGRREVDLGACRAVWWHRPDRSALPDALAGPDREHAREESHEALAGVWAGIGPLWVNDPIRAEVAARKTFQLGVAAAAGLRIPRTLVTNDPLRARAFVRALSGRRGPGAVRKLVSGTRERWHGTTRVAGPRDPALGALRLAPAVLQEYVDGTDLRVTVVGRRVFAMEVDVRATRCETDLRLGWAEACRSARRAGLPAEVRERLLATMERLGLVYGAFDLRRRDSGEHVFLEVNPAGQWLFVEATTGAPITDALARLLAGADARRRVRPR